jgi:protein O-GlcNAc transferase
MNSENNNITTGKGRDVSRLMTEAVEHQQGGRFQQAEWLYQAVLQLQPAHADASHNLGVVAMQTNRPAEALPHLKAALEARPEVGQYWLTYLAALVQAGHPDVAAQVLEQGRQRGLSGAEVDRLAVRLGLADDEPTQEAIGQALDLFSQGRLAELEPIARTLTERFPKHGFGWQLLGVVRKEQGRYGEALAPLRKAAELLPGDADVQIDLGLVCQALGDLKAAEASQRQAIESRPDSAAALYNLGNVLLADGRPGEAEASYRRALAASPDLAEAHNNLGAALQAQGRLDDAEACFRRALAGRPDYVAALNNLGGLLAAEGRAAEAESSFRQALVVDADNAETHFQLANVLKDQGRHGDAEAAYRRAIELRPNYALAHANLGALRQLSGRLGEAEASCRRALDLSPDLAEAHNNLGFVLLHQGVVPDAKRCFERALALRPDLAAAHANLGALLAAQGRFDAAEASLRRALTIDPDYEDAYGSLLYALNYHPDKTAAEVFAAYREYDERFGKPGRAAWRAHANGPDPDRRLKVGYVSPDFNAHSVGRFLEPLLAGHDKRSLSVYAYADLWREDEATARYRGYVDHWLPTLGMSDEDLAERIRADGIDILVDLAGHTTGNRLGVFARKPAPVSVTWLGYGYTTGLSAIDYFLTDRTTVPEGAEDLFAETPWRLTTPGYTYRPAPAMGEVGALPALERGYVTFGTLTRAVRLNHRTIRVWAAILDRLPNSRLVIDSRDFQDPALREELAGRFAAHGIDQGRLDIGYHTPPWDVLRGMDIGLDCFPHNSGTTLFESLYLGVPFVTLAGRPSVGRLGSSILEGVGHPEWIAASEEDYIDKAVALAADLPQLAIVRAALRQEMQASPLMDEAGFAGKVEAAYRAMWVKWARENR